jgi:alanyl-tRNA synthetase
MDSNQVRQTFLDFFRSKGHRIVPSAPMVVKGDPTLMFNNSGMAPFKDLFLGNAPIQHPRIADTQKCLRVSGKHNDLEEVGVDTYHHTMFEMLGNWSFGDYFKKEAISWAWELLTDTYKLDPEKLYVTVFEGNPGDGLVFDQEAADTWRQFVPEERILKGNKKDNFWEMGDMGPCGPCTEIHYDCRDDQDREEMPGAALVNSGHPQVIEIWNVVFMEFERKADGSLVKLPKRHVDTGMGFERLVRVLQRKSSNYETDIFMPLIAKTEDLSGLRYKPSEELRNRKQEHINIAMRVIADHVRAIAFSIADGQLPGNTGAGYVIRRILRRAIRYGYQTLNLKEPFLYRLVPVLANQMGGAFPELNREKVIIEKVMREEEQAFYRTLEVGLKRIDQVCIDTRAAGRKEVEGKTVFELYDTFGFPTDLTSLIARGYGLAIDEAGFEEQLARQKARSRAATQVDTDDWVYVEENRSLVENLDRETEFEGYDLLECEARIIRYRKVKSKNREQYHVVLNRTPFYAESGGQVGDTGVLENANDTVFITDTRKEAGVIIHVADKLPLKPESAFMAKVNRDKRLFTTNNHTATHLLHAALRTVLGTHVEQKGSLVNEEHLRFDFSHTSKLTDEEIREIEQIVNRKIRENIARRVEMMGIGEAKKSGAMALFGEKYGDVVRVVTFDRNFSVELCGGCHVSATGQIGLFKIVSEGAVAAGIRRIEAITSIRAEEYFRNQEMMMDDIRQLLKQPKDVLKSVTALIEENQQLQKKLQQVYREKAVELKKHLASHVHRKNGMSFLAEQVSFENAEEIKNVLFELRKEIPNLFCVLAADVNGKPSISVAIGDELVKDKKLNAGEIVRELAKEINGGGGGQPFYAQAGGTKLEGLSVVIEKAKEFVK